jgi:Glu-tRNA(Gln) amidotransferase subunit E-like FAD-binding protein
VRVVTKDVTERRALRFLEPLRPEAWERFVAAERRRLGMELGPGPFRVLAVLLPGLAGTLRWPTQPGRTFADELRGRVRVIAGLDQAPVLYHSEDWPGHAAAELGRLRGAMGGGDGDGLVVVWGPERDVHTAAEEIRLRYVDATDGVPNETRQPFEDGHTDFERILPGPDRMYPDTDSPPTRVTRERVGLLRAALPEPTWEREARYAAAGVPSSVAHYLVRRGGAVLVDRVAREADADLRHAAFFFGERLKGLRRAGVAVDRVGAERWVELFRAFSSRPALRDAWEALVRRIAAQPADPVAAAVAALGLGQEPPAWREGLVRAIASAEHEAYRPDPARVLRHATGRVMDALRGRVPAAEVVAALRQAAEVRR